METSENTNTNGSWTGVIIVILLALFGGGYFFMASGAGEANGAESSGTVENVQEVEREVEGTDGDHFTPQKYSHLMSREKVEQIGLPKVHYQGYHRPIDFSATTTDMRNADKYPIFWGDHHYQTDFETRVHALHVTVYTDGPRGYMQKRERRVFFNPENGVMLFQRAEDNFLVVKPYSPLYEKMVDLYMVDDLDNKNPYFMLSMKQMEQSFSDKSEG